MASKTAGVKHQVANPSLQTWAWQGIWQGRQGRQQRRRRRQAREQHRPCFGRRLECIGRTWGLGNISLQCWVVILENLLYHGCLIGCILQNNVVVVVDAEMFSPVFDWLRIWIWLRLNLINQSPTCAFPPWKRCNFQRRSFSPWSRRSLWTWSEFLVSNPVARQPRCRSTKLRTHLHFYRHSFRGFWEQNRELGLSLTRAR